MGPRSPECRRLGVVAAFMFALTAGAVTIDGQTVRARRHAVTEASVRGHMAMLASDAMNGRASGSRDEWIAATYVAAHLERWGIEPLGDRGGYIQEVPTDRGELIGATLTAPGGVTVEYGRGFRVQSAGQGSAAGPLVRYTPGVALPPGSVVLVVGPVLPSSQDTAQVAAVLSLEDDARRLLALPTVTTATGRRPWRLILDAASFAAFIRLPDATPLSLRVDVRPGRTWNVVGRIPGRHRTRAAEVVLLTAHLDHIGAAAGSGDAIFNGADDNASGSTCVLELAEVLATSGRPDRTVVFAWFGSEEVGLLGSRQFIEHPPVPLERIVVNLNFEMIGRPDKTLAPGTVWMTGYERSNLGPRLAGRGARLVADPYPAQRFFMRSDNYELALRGVVAHTVSSFGLHRDYHTPGDDLSRIDFAHMASAIRSLVEPVRWLAYSDFTPEWRAGLKPVRGSR